MQIFLQILKTKCLFKKTHVKSGNDIHLDSNNEIFFLEAVAIIFH